MLTQNSNLNTINKSHVLILVMLKQKEQKSCLIVGTNKENKIWFTLFQTTGNHDKMAAGVAFVELKSPRSGTVVLKSLYINLFANFKAYFFSTNLKVSITSTVSIISTFTLYSKRFFKKG